MVNKFFVFSVNINPSLKDLITELKQKKQKHCLYKSHIDTRNNLSTGSFTERSWFIVFVLLKIYVYIPLYSACWSIFFFFVFIYYTSIVVVVYKDETRIQKDWYNIFYKRNNISFETLTTKGLCSIQSTNIK